MGKAWKTSHILCFIVSAGLAAASVCVTYYEIKINLQQATVVKNCKE